MKGKGHESEKERHKREGKRGEAGERNRRRETDIQREAVIGTKQSKKDTKEKIREGRQERETGGERQTYRERQ